MHHLESSNEIIFLRDASRLIESVKCRKDGFKVLPALSVCIQPSADWENTLLNLSSWVEMAIPKLFEFGEKRAHKAFISTSDTITKPSYSKRLVEPFLGASNAQIENLVRLFKKEPNSGGLVFTVFEPKDLEFRRRPGYVPCIVAGTFQKVGDRLDLMTFFRSQSLIEFAIFDLLFLRSLQTVFIERVRTNDDRFQDLKVGQLNLTYNRIVVPDRLAKKKTSWVHRNEALPAWLDVIERAAQSIDLLSNSSNEQAMNIFRSKKSPIA